MASVNLNKYICLVLNWIGMLLASNILQIARYNNADVLYITWIKLAISISLPSTENR